MITKELMDELNAVFSKHGISKAVVIVNSGPGIGYSYPPNEFTWTLGAVEMARALLRARAIRAEEVPHVPSPEEKGPLGPN